MAFLKDNRSDESRQPENNHKQVKNVIRKDQELKIEFGDGKYSNWTFIPKEANSLDIVITKGNLQSGKAVVNHTYMKSHDISREKSTVAKVALVFVHMVLLTLFVIMILYVLSIQHRKAIDRDTLLVKDANTSLIYKTNNKY